MPRLQPIRLLLSVVAGRIHREQAATIDYLLEENRVLREQLGKRRLRLTDDQRRRLAAKGVALGHRLLDRHLPAAGGGAVTVSERLGELLKHYHRAA